MPNTPTHRTRSGSNAQITYQDMKALIENLRTDLTSKIVMVNDKIDELFQRAVESEERVRVLEERCNALWTNLAQRNTNPDLHSEEMLREVEERHRRRKYLVISGIPEQVTGSVEERREADIKAIEDVSRFLGFKDLVPMECSRIGNIRQARHRLLRFKCKTEDKKRSFLSAARNLRSSPDYKNVFVNPDETFVQRKRGREMRQELRRRREAGERVIIRRGQIIEEPRKQNFQ